ncbi:MAG: BatA domain-containing protein [Opitutales bacterium]
MIEFGQPLALWAGLSLGLPILAHMAYRQITDRKLFPTLRFLSRSSIPRSGRKKPSDWLLLVLRCLLFVLVVLLLADPYIPAETATDDSVRKKVLIVLDRSSSMQGWNAWDEAVQCVSNQLQSPDTDFAFLSFGGGAMITRNLGTPREELRSLVGNMTPGEGRSSVEAMLQTVPEILGVSPGDREVVLISDFQQSDWQGVYGRLGSQGFTVKALPVGHGSMVGNMRLGNRAIVETKVVPHGADEIKVWTVVRNWDDQPMDTNISAYNGQKLLQSQKILLPAVGTAQAQFFVPNSSFARLTIKLEGQDELSIDDNRTVWVTAPPSRKFGFWSSESPRDMDLLEKNYLSVALESSGDGGWDRWEHANDLAEQMKSPQSRSQLNVLGLIGASDWLDKGELSEALSLFLGSGGTVFATPGESPVRMNQTFKKHALLDFTFSRLEQTPFRMAPHRIGTLDESSKLSEVFSGDSSRDLYLTKIRKFLMLKNLESEIEVPLRNREGHPLVLVKKFPGGGRFVLFCFRMTTDWTDLPVRNSFLPLFVEVCGLSFADSSFSHTTRLNLGDQYGEGESTFIASKPGLFKVNNQLIEVVSPLSESMPEVLNAGEVTSMISGPIPAASTTEKEISPTDRKDQSLWLWITCAILCVVLFENIFSRPNPSEKGEGNVIHA